MKYLVVIFLFITCKPVPKAHIELKQFPSYHAITFKASSLTLPYRILKPKKITKDTPIVLFLHGAGERGDDNERQLVHGSKLFLDSLEKYPAIYVYPQCPIEGYWSNVNVDRTVTPLELVFDSTPIPTPAMKAILELIDLLITKHDLKKNGHKVLGLSMGGMGTFEILQYLPDYFNKAIAICGGGHQNWVNDYSDDLSIWVAHGIEDNVVNIKESQLMVEAIRARNIKLKFDQYPSVGHNSWDNLFADPNMLPWLLD